MPGRVAERRPALEVGLAAVIVAVTDQEPRVLTVAEAPGELAALPAGSLDPGSGLTLERALRGWVSARAALELGYVEQLYTFGDPLRDPRAAARLLSIAYLALLREGTLRDGGAGRWQPVYSFLPWEDQREGPPALLAERLLPALQRWAGTATEARARVRRRERVDIAFGRHGARWDPERVLERYELLYEAGFVEEALRADGAGAAGAGVGAPMAFDHRRMLATALGRLRGKIRYRPVVFELLLAEFTLFQLQRVVEALSGVGLHKQNFRRLVEGGGLVEATGGHEPRTGGRPAALFRFRREVLRERPAPGVGIPKSR